MTVSQERRQAQLAEATAAAANPLVTEHLIDLYYRHVPTRDLTERQPDDLVGPLLAHLELAATRQQDQILVTAFTPTVESNGWATGTTVVQIVTADTAFVVDSVTAALVGLGHEIRLLVHPQLAVLRTDEGDLTEVGADTGTVESWVHIEVGRIPDQAAIAELVASLQRVLSDVAVAVADWRPMLERAEAISAELDTQPATADADERSEAQQLISWLLDDHFLFLGYRQYRLFDEGAQTALERVPGTGLGLLRDESAPAKRVLPPAQAAQARLPRLLIITKANSKSTVHRSSYLDYVAVRTFAADGTVTGEHRFLGLFTSRAYNSSVMSNPLLAAKVNRALDLSSFTPHSHLAKDFLSVMEGFPRDKVLQADTEYLCASVSAVVGSRHQRQSQLFLREDPFGRFVSCVVYLPRDRYNTRIRTRIQELLVQAFGGLDVEYAARVGDSPLAMVHYRVRVPAGSGLSKVDTAELESWLRAVIRTWDSEWRSAMAAEFGESAATGLIERWGAGLDDAYQATHDPRQAAVDVRFLHQLQPGGMAARLSRTKGAAPAPAAIALKLAPKRIPHLPQPHPEFEIWVYSPRVDGVHLRFGEVARGGLRWSDRKEDFRTEVLGLVKAQMVKNAVIVPAGAKGGFYAKQLPDPQDRAAWLAGGRDAYREFVGAMLNVTDNLVANTIVPPERVVRHDADDPYLVVAADKGTAAFSDLANEVSQAHGFWLDDAFASGGSAGYDHKQMGITARGAWESVKRHLRELEIDESSQDFTVVGIGDMSGDVFGNGMLLSNHIRLVAAFDHRHIFVDPDPDAATSFTERQRLFALPHSSWADYDADLISEGGGVFPRAAKSVPVSPQMRAVLGLDDVTELTPTELIRAALKARVDLLWNGGIGTYIKAATEQHSEVGDRANDAVRVDGGELRCRVVGEGGNLGATQRGRIEAARTGIRINTDAIDNSAGVDSSDHEVNIKILVNQVVAAGDMTRKQRDELLASMTDDVAARVLRTNFEQNVLLGNARHLGNSMLGAHGRLLDWLERRGELDRELEALPDHDELARRASEGESLTSPEFAVIVAYAKLALKEDLLATDLPDDPWLEFELSGYFPAALGDFATAMRDHPLRREIIVNRVANSLVNRGGITFANRASEETGATIAQITKAYIVAREVMDLRGFITEVEQLGSTVSAATVSELYVRFRRLLERTVRVLLSRRPELGAIGAEIDRYRDRVSGLRARLPALLTPEQRSEVTQRADVYVARGLPEALAQTAATLVESVPLLDVIDISAALDVDPAEAATVYYLVAEVAGMDVLLDLTGALPHEDRWDAMARASLRLDLYRIMKQLTADVLTTGNAGSPAEQVAAWRSDHEGQLAKLHEIVTDIERSPDPRLSPLWVVLRDLRNLQR